MDDGNGSFCVKAYKKSSLPKVPTREQLHRNYIRSRQEEKIVAEHMKMNYNKMQYENTDIWFHVKHINLCSSVG